MGHCRLREQEMISSCGWRGVRGRPCPAGLAVAMRAPPYPYELVGARPLSHMSVSRVIVFVVTGVFVVESIFVSSTCV